MRRITFIVLFVVMILGALPVSSVSAYNTLGGKWSNVGSLTYYYYTSVAVDQTAYGQAVTDWNNTPTLIWVTATSPAGYEDIGLYSDNNNSVSWDGITYLSPSASANPYTYAQVKLNDYYTNSYTATERQSVSEHEFGHVFGLAHTSGAVLMNPYTCGTSSRWCTYSINTPTQDEINGINWIY